MSTRTMKKTHRNVVRLVNLELSRLVQVGLLARIQQIQELFQQIKVLARDVGHLEDGADAV